MIEIGLNNTTMWRRACSAMPVQQLIGGAVERMSVAGGVLRMPGKMVTAIVLLAIARCLSLSDLRFAAISRSTTNFYQKAFHRNIMDPFCDVPTKSFLAGVGWLLRNHCNKIVTSAL